MSESEVKIEVMLDDPKANNETSGGDGASCLNSQGHEGLDDINIQEMTCCTKTLDIKNENGNKAVSVHEDTIVHVIENSSDMKNTATRHNKIKPHGWNKTKCYLFLFFILLFFVWVIVYYAWNQGYISQLIQFTE